MKRLALLALLLLAACNDTPAEPAKPRTLNDAAKQFDEAIVALGWAQRDLWALGGRDIVVSVQIDTSVAPVYLRLPRKAVP